MQIATIIFRRELARARVLSASLAEHSPAQLAVLVLDPAAEDQSTSEAFEVLRPEHAGIRDFGVLAATLTAKELREACKPLLIEHLLGRGPVVYLGADSLVFGPLEDLGRLAAEHGLLVKRRTSRSLPRDGRRPNEADLDVWGLHDDGLLAFGADHDHSELLRWWATRTREGSHSGIEMAPVDRLATFGPGAFELADDGVGASFWDLHDRAITAHEQSTLIDGSPLRLMRFDGFDTAKPLALSSAQDRLPVVEIPELAALCRRYAELLLEAGEAECAALPYGFDQLPDGTRLDHRLRTICRRAADSGSLRHSPFTLSGEQELYAWLSAPAATGTRFGVNRLCMLVRELHPELREAYPDLDDERDAYGMFLWLHEHCVREGTLPARVVPPPTAKDIEANRRWHASELNFGVNVAGYFNAELGVGEAARLIVRSLDGAGVPLLPVVPPTPPPSRQQHPYAAVPASAAQFPINVICVNADGLGVFHNDVGTAFFEKRHNIGMWWWEVDVLPTEWHSAFELLDEVWVGTDHVARALEPVSPVPVHTVRLPIIAPRVAPLPRAMLGLDDEYVFLSMFDHGSVVERKNPIGTIAAFAEAFAPDSGAVLVLKSTNGDHDPRGRQRVREAAAPHPHVHLLETYLSPAQTRALIATADCFVSLHRSEGFGLGPAEAMAIGKPVVATGYSGNLDYMTQANAYLVDYTIVEVGPGCWPYPEGAHWAEVDLGHAARLLREVFDDQAAARERGALAAADVARTHSVDAAGRSMRARLEYVFAGRQALLYLPLPEYEKNLTRGRRGRVLRRLAPGVFRALEAELAALWAASEQHEFDLRALERGTLLSTQAATLAALRRVEAAAEGTGDGDPRRGAARRGSIGDLTDR